MTADKIENIKAEMESFFGDDRKRIDHALKVLAYARQINSVEGAEHLIVDAAAILHDIGIHKAEEKYGSNAGKFQELEGPPIARRILEKNGFAETAIDHICAIIANHHSAKNIDTPEFRVVWDADWLVNIPDEYKEADKQTLTKIVRKIFKTNKGKEIAKTIFLQNGKEEYIRKPR